MDQGLPKKSSKRKTISFRVSADEYDLYEKLRNLFFVDTSAWLRSIYKAEAKKAIEAGGVIYEQEKRTSAQ